MNPSTHPFEILSDQNLLERIERKDAFNKEAVISAYKILKERGYDLEYPFPNEEDNNYTIKEPDSETLSIDPDNALRKANRISIGRIVIFFLVFIPLLYLSNFYLKNTYLFRQIHILSGTIISLGAITYLIDLTVFSTLFFTIKSNRDKFLSFDSSKVYVALKVFLFSVLFVSLLELLFRKEVTVYQSFIENSYRSFLGSFIFVFLVALTEELIFKWLLLTQILLRLGFTKKSKIIAYTIVGIIFALVHIPSQLTDHESVQYGHLILVFLFSYFSSILYVRHQNFPLLVALHFFLDIVVTFVENGSYFYLYVGLILIGIYSIPKISGSMLFTVRVTSYKPKLPVLLAIPVLPLFLLIFIPKSYLDHYDIAQDYYYLDLNQEAKLNIDLALRINGNHIPSLNMKGNMLFDQDRFDEAFSYYNTAARIDSSINYVIRNRGFANRELKNYHQGIKDLTRVIDNGMEDARIFENRGTCYLGIKSYENAKIDYYRSLELKPKNELALYGLARVYTKEEQFDSSLYYLEKTIKINPKNFAAYELLAVAYARLGKYDQAINIVDKAIYLGTKSPTRFYIRGLVYYYQEDYFKAHKEFEKSLELLPEDEDLYFNLAYSYLFLKNQKKGCEYLTKAANLGHLRAAMELEEYCKK